MQRELHMLAKITWGGVVLYIYERIYQGWKNHTQSFVLLLSYNYILLTLLIC
jgi:hypothetical protein